MGNQGVPAFLKKLYKMVSDPRSNDLITWSGAGNSFIVKKPQEFAKEILPKFFKHNNFSSFVRQLNMYGFHKIPHLQQGVLQSDEQSEQWEFGHKHFLCNQPELLCYITRRKVNDNESIKEEPNTRKEGNGNENIKEQEPNEVDINRILNEIDLIKKYQATINATLKYIQRNNQVQWQETIPTHNVEESSRRDMNYILNEIDSIKKYQTTLNANLKNIQRDNQILLQEIISVHNKYHHQQNTLNKLLKFLASLYHTDKKTLSKKRKLLLENSDEADFLSLDINNSVSPTSLTINNDQFDISNILPSRPIPPSLTEQINDTDFLGLTPIDLSEIETRTDEDGSNIDYLTTLTSQIPDEAINLEDNFIENGNFIENCNSIENDNSIENGLLSYYNMNFNPIEQDQQLLYDFN
ncbi:unnamed protein product [Rhizophagus irregularis]|nr:unnamed protein product [Rhizophagus irregularis]